MKLEIQNFIEKKKYYVAFVVGLFEIRVKQVAPE